MDGEPLAKATVIFQPVEDGGKPGFAKTDESGHFEPQTFERGDGLTAGKHRVSIQKTVMVDSDGNVVEGETDGLGLTEKHLLPEKYADFSTSGIEVTVEPDGPNELEPFNLSSEDEAGAAAEISSEDEAGAAAEISSEDEAGAAAE